MKLANNLLLLALTGLGDVVRGLRVGRTTAEKTKTVQNANAISDNTTGASFQGCSSGEIRMLSPEGNIIELRCSSFLHQTDDGDCDLTRLRICARPDGHATSFAVCE